MKCMTCDGWVEQAAYAWPDGLSFVGCRCEPCARATAEHRARAAGAPFTPWHLQGPPPSRLIALPAIYRRTL